MEQRLVFSRPSRRRHFTLIEIMIVVVIIGMLAALVGPNIIGNLDKAKVKNTKAQLVNLKSAVQQFYFDMSAYPNRLEDLITNPGDDKWDGPYIESKTVPKDNWDNEFQYNCPGDGQPFDIISLGADKAGGGTGNNADISCWN
ncbi:MAG: type II secretion system major pseudopilin GspG [Lentisphaeria bacterium]|jgi:general secretion pathway protein G|nr:type II secretion system major pseudopilin GspG [Lentisphaeria bacterium]MDY0175609.1 type II secretion system major pseudopilin GspG [Lentisphaeria bacterium]